MGRALAFLVCSLVIFGSTAVAKTKTSHLVYYKPGEILVKFKSELINYPLAKANLYELTGAQVMRRYHVPNGLEHIRVSKADVTEALSYYRSHPMVEYAEPNFIYTLDGEPPLPNDPLFNQEWSLYNTGQKDSTGQEGTPDADIDALEAWEKTAGDKNVIVAVIDTGIDYTHQDITENMWMNPGEIADNKIDDDGNGFIDDIYGWNFADKINTPKDDHGHGTHVAGTIAAVGNNDIGVIGVAPGVRLMAVKFLNSFGSGELADAVLAINYAVQMGAKVLNNSWGGGGFSQTLFDAIEAASQKNVVFAAAAGNDSENNDTSKHYPSSYDIANVIAVAATNNRDELAKFSNFGVKTVHVAAPGDNILSSVLNNEYQSYSGTSMATPHVSGISALLLSSEPDLTPEEIKTRLIETSDEVLSFRRKIIAQGRVNAYNAMFDIIPPKKTPKDPGGWKNVSYKLSTPHDYLPNTQKSWEIHQEGATYLKIHFKKFDTEEGYDFVKITDKEGNLADQMDGKMKSFWTFIIRGDTATIHFASDDQVNRYGFDIDKFAYSTLP